MHKLTKIFFCIFLTPFFSGCFEIREEIDINKDSSGKYSLVLDLSQSKAMIDRAMPMMAEEKSKNPINQADSSFSKNATRLNSMSGITNAVGINNKTDYIFGMQFDFENIDALNNALQEVNKDKNPDMTSFPPIYKYSKGKLERTNNYYLKGLLDEIEKKEGNETNLVQLKLLLEEANFAYIIRTNGKIKKFTNKKAELSYTKKELRYSANLMEVMAGKIDFSNIVKFK